jgi:hypothetical protein
MGLGMMRFGPMVGLQLIRETIEVSAAMKCEETTGRDSWMEPQVPVLETSTVALINLIPLSWKLRLRMNV